MRIIAGKWRSRQLKRPDTAATRPMPDRIKEAIFNSLGARYGSPGALPALRVADLFAGSGSLGLEALSRGAASCCFVEDNVDALAALRLNVGTLHADSWAKIADRDAWAFGASAAGRKPFDLIFLDPPYRDSEDDSTSGRVAGFLQSLTAGGPNGTIVLLHHPAAVRFDAPRTDGWTVTDVRKFGTNGITLFSR